MKKKNRVALIITVILLLVAIGLILTNSYTTLRKDVSEFSVQDTALITKIFIADKLDNQVTLERQEDGNWTVNEIYTAQQAKISSFLKTLQELRVRSPVPLAARNNVITRMSAIARKIEIYQVVPRINLFNVIQLFPREKNVKTYYIGDVTSDNQGTFMLMEGADEPFIVHITGFRGFVATRFSAIPSDWRDYTVFKTRLSQIESVQVEFPQEPDQSYLVKVQDRQNITMRSLQDNRTLDHFDTLRVMSFLTAFEDIRFESLLETLIEREFIDSVITSTPHTIITLTEKTGVRNEVLIFKKRGFAPLYMEDGAALEPVDLDRAFALVSNREDFVLIQYYVFDRVTRRLDYLLGGDLPPLL